MRTHALFVAALAGAAYAAPFQAADRSVVEDLEGLTKPPATKRQLQGVPGVSGVQLEDLVALVPSPGGLRTRQLEQVADAIGDKVNLGGLRKKQLDAITEALPKLDERQLSSVTSLLTGLTSVGSSVKERQLESVTGAADGLTNGEGSSISPRQDLTQLADVLPIDSLPVGKRADLSAVEGLAQELPVNDLPVDKRQLGSLGLGSLTNLTSITKSSPLKREDTEVPEVTQAVEDLPIDSLPVGRRADLSAIEGLTKELPVSDLPVAKRQLGSLGLGSLTNLTKSLPLKREESEIAEPIQALKDLPIDNLPVSKRADLSAVEGLTEELPVSELPIAARQLGTSGLGSLANLTSITKSLPLKREEEAELPEPTQALEDLPIAARQLETVTDELQNTDLPVSAKRQLEALTGLLNGDSSTSDATKSGLPLGRAESSSEHATNTGPRLPGLETVTELVSA